MHVPRRLAFAARIAQNRLPEDASMPSARKLEPALPLPPELGQIADILARGGEGEASRITEERLETLYTMGHGLLTAGEFADAITVFTCLCLHDHGSHRFWMGLGGSLQGAGNLEKAIDAYGMAGLCGALDDPEPFYRIALCHLKQKRVDAANQILDVVARMGGDDDTAQATFRQEIAELRESLTMGANGNGPPECSPKHSPSSRRTHFFGASYR
jgi:type III secretion system low calcium response chaperone LcrH/SycD